MDRRTTIKWMFAAAAAVPSLRSFAYTPEPLARDVAASQAGYGTDPDLVKEWKPGGPWPLTLGVHARLTTAVLCDLIIPADECRRRPLPSASSISSTSGSARPIRSSAPIARSCLPGLVWIDAEAQKRFGKAFAALDAKQQKAPSPTTSARPARRRRSSPPRQSSLRSSAISPPAVSTPRPSA